MARTVNRDTLGLHNVWLAALAAFILAGATGALLRWSSLYGMPAGLTWNNVRHAHSHLMYFAWVTPALMSLIAAHLPPQVDRSHIMRLRRVAVITFILGLLTYPSFLLYGYAPANVGGARLPLSNILSSLNILSWYVYIAFYVRAIRGRERTVALRFWNAAFAFMILASLGAWARAVQAAMHVESPFWTGAAVLLFLGTFSDGWFVLALLGLAYAILPRAREAIGDFGRNLMIIGLPVVFLMGMPVQDVPPGLRLIGGVGGVLVALGTLINVWGLWPTTRGTRGWRTALLFLGIKAVAQWIAASPAVALWAESVGLRIPYLHVLLLGFVTLGLIAAAEATWWPKANIGLRWMVASVWVLVGSLLLLTHLWPAAWGGAWVTSFAAWAALAPVLAALWVMYRAVRSEPRL